MATVSTAVTLDPHRHDSYYTSTTLAHVVEPLVRLGPQNELVPALAVSWQNPAERTWRFRLRSGVRFHDGTFFGAADVLASLERIRRIDSPARGYVSSIESVRAVDDATLEIRTRRRDPTFLASLAFVSILPRTTPDGEIRRPVGTGPYRFVSAAADGRIAMSRFDGYRDAPAFERVTFFALPESADRARAIADGRADVVLQFPPEAWDEAGRSGRVTLVARTGNAVDFLAFPVRRGPFADRRVRLAVAKTLDRGELVRRSFHGRANPAEQIVPPTVMGYARGLRPPARDVDAARHLLAEAGLPNGFASPLVVGARFEALAREVARQLAAVGIALTLEVLTQSAFYARSVSGEMPFALTSYGSDTGDAGNSLRTLLHTRLDGLGTINLGGYSNPDLDALVERADLADQPAERLDLLARALAVVVEDVPILPLTVRQQLQAFRPGLRWTPTGNRFRAGDVSPE